MQINGNEAEVKRSTRGRDEDDRFILIHVDGNWDDGIDRSPPPLRLSHIMWRLLQWLCDLFGHKSGYYHYGDICDRCGKESDVAFET